MTVLTYLFLDGRTEEALDFYKKAVGAEVTMLMKFKESPDKAQFRPAAMTRSCMPCSGLATRRS